MMRNLRTRLDALAKTVPPESKQAAADSLATPRIRVLRAEIPLAQEDLCAYHAVTRQDARVIDPFVEEFSITTALFLDTETTGLARGVGTIAFLVGMGWVEENAFVVEQHLMLDYGGEAEVLRAVHERIERAETLVTYNGKSFDIPLLASRMVLARLRMPERAQLDLLHAARRFWKLRVGDCSLSHIEESILGMVRQGDIPGAEIPQRFFDFLRTGEAHLLDDVVEHNRRDVVSMASILGRMGGMVQSIGRQTSLPVEDAYSLGRVLERAGREEDAIVHYHRAMTSQTAWVARRSLAKLYKKRRDDLLACEVLGDAVRRGLGGMEAMYELMRLYEWRMRDFDAALAIVDAALKRLDMMERLRGGFLIGTSTERAELEKRRERLRKKQQKQRDAGYAQQL